MKISASHWMFEGGRSIEEVLREARDVGFEAVELAVASSGVLTHETTQTECEDIVAAAERIGVEISSVASGENWSCSPSANDPEVRKKIVDFTHRALQVANWLGTDAYLYIPGAVEVFFLENSEVIPYEVCCERATEAIKEIIPTAEETGVTIGVENVWNKFLLSPTEMRDFIDSFNSKAVGAYFDVGNVLLTGFPDQWIRILGDRIARIHVKDFKTSIGTIAGFVDLLEGDVDFDAVKEALAEVGYDGYATAEILPYEEGRLKKTADAMRKIFK